MKHKYLKHLFTTLLLLCTTMAKAHDFEVGGIYYSITDATNKTVEVTFKGTSYNEYSHEYTGSVVIPESVTSYNGITYSVTSIGNYALRGCTGLTSIIIPNSLASIGDYAFYDCSGLDSVVIPNSVTSIGYSAFDGCIGLVSVEIGNGITNFGNYAFAYCSSLVNITSRIPANSIFAVNTKVFDGVDKTASTLYVPYGAKETYASTAGWNEFANIVELEPEIITGGSCGKNVTWTLVDDVLTISGSGAMDDFFDISVPWEEYSDGIHTVIIEEGVTSIGNAAFRDCSGLTSVIIGNSVTSIGYMAFIGCTGLISIVIPNSVTSIGEYAFYACSGLTSIVIPNSVEIIRYSAFDNTAWYNNQPDGVIYAGKVLYKYKGTMPSNTSVVVKEGTLGVAEYAFEGCSGLTKIEIPNSVTSIGNWAFEGCYGLTSVVIGNSVTSIGNYAFYGCSGLTSVVIPNSVTSIGERAFNNCDGLTSVVIPNSVTSIGSYAFSYCDKLTNVVIGNSVTSIGECAFYACSGLTSIVIPNSVTSIGYSAFHDCSGLTSIVVSKENSVYDSRNDCNAIIETSTNVLIIGCQNTVIPTSVESIRNYAFYRCFGLTSIVIPNSVTSIGHYAFAGCSGLTSVVIGNSVTSIGERAFYDCSGLTSITSLIPADELFTVVNNVFYSVDKTYCTLYVPYGAKETYASTAGWSEFANIVELEPTATEVIIVINQYGAATYCSPYALDFSEVEGLKAYSAIGFNSGTQVVTLARVMTTPAEAGIFVKGEPGEYVVPVIEECNEHTLNLLVGTLEQTTVNSTDGVMSNYKFTVAELDEVPMFYPFEDNTAFSAGKAYLQIPTAWLPATAQKSVSIRFDEGETTDIEELKGENGEVKTIYDLQGRVVENPTSGIYIIDGKKVIIK